MPNRKIKHIVAKLVGASTEETLDVYDVDAIHTDKIYNALDQTAAGYVLDARQGKALNDSLTNYIIVSEFTNSEQFVVAANTAYVRTVNVTVPSGYKFLAVSNTITNGNMLPSYCSNESASWGSTGSFTLNVWVMNHSATQKTVTGGITLRALFIKA